MRVYVESQYYAWEFEAIKEAILDGTLTYTPKPVVNAHDLVSMEIAGKRKAIQIDVIPCAEALQAEKVQQ